MRLTTRDHDRGVGGATYVYPVVSRRARGVSIGINLNPNRACNWRCVYCQVPGLVHGKGPPIDLAQLRSELEATLDAFLVGGAMERSVPEGYRRLNDLAFSGDGEPTSSPQFAEAVGLAADTLRARGLDEVRLVLITNGSLVRKPEVQEGLRLLGSFGGDEPRGEAWYKLDRATDAGIAAVNSVATGVRRALEGLRITADLCPTWVQTCMFARGGEAPGEDEVRAYLDALRALRDDGVPLRGVLLYGLARLSHQPEAPELSPVEPAWLEALGARIRELGWECRVHA